MSGLLGCVLRRCDRRLGGLRVDIRLPPCVKTRLFSLDVIVKGLLSGTVHKTVRSRRQDLGYDVRCRGKVLQVRMGGDTGKGSLQGKRQCLDAGGGGRKRNVNLRGIECIIRGCRKSVRVVSASRRFRVQLFLCVSLKR